MDTFQQSIDDAKDSVNRAQGRLIGGLQSTEDDKLNWSPSTSARSPIRVAVHGAQMVHDITEMLGGRTFDIKTTAEAEIFFAEHEVGLSTRQEVFEILEKNSAEYLVWLDKLTPQTLEGSMTLPFGFGVAHERPCQSVSLYPDPLRRPRLALKTETDDVQEYQDTSQFRAAGDRGRNPRRLAAVRA